MQAAVDFRGLFMDVNIGWPGKVHVPIWPPTAEIKYLNLAICDCEGKFHYVILACGYGGS